MDEKAVEIVARALCRAFGVGEEHWAAYSMLARTHIAAHDALSEYLREKVLGK